MLDYDLKAIYYMPGNLLAIILNNTKIKIDYENHYS